MSVQKKEVQAVSDDDWLYLYCMGTDDRKKLMECQKHRIIWLRDEFGYSYREIADRMVCVGKSMVAYVCNTLSYKRNLTNTSSYLSNRKMDPDRKQKLNMAKSESKRKQRKIYKHIKR